VVTQNRKENAVLKLYWVTLEDPTCNYFEVRILLIAAKNKKQAHAIAVRDGKKSVNVRIPQWKVHEKVGFTLKTGPGIVMSGGYAE
jgi:hypothetical protein